MILKKLNARKHYIWYTFNLSYVFKDVEEEITRHSNFLVNTLKLQHLEN